MRHILYALSGLLLGGLLLGGGPLLAAPLTGPGPDGRTLEFILNKGQLPKAVRYSAAVPGGQLYLEPDGLRYVLLEPIAHPHEGPERHPLPGPADAVRGHQVRVRFVGADAGAALLPAEPTGEVRNYLRGNDPAAWASEVPSYRQVRYQAAWPGVGAVFYENQQHQLEYDFELAPGTDPARVQLRYEGASTLGLDGAGRLHVGTTLGELTELSPAAYQADPATGRRHAVACHYQLDAATSTVSFRLGRYDHRRPLVIDPTVQFSTLTGSTADNWGFTAAYDVAGNMYSGGIAFDVGYPASVGAFQTTFGGIIDIALIKYNTTVSGPAARVWATYLGGSAHDYPSSLVVNSNNELVMLGTTASGNYPTTAGAAQRSFSGGTSADPFNDGGIFVMAQGTDIVVTRLSSNGGSLLASTYLGGSGTDGLVPFSTRNPGDHLPQNYGDTFRGDVLTDDQGNVYLSSVTASTNFPVTAGSFGPSFRGGLCDAVVAKLSPTLGLVWSGYLGGSAADAAYSLQRDAAGNVYVAGGTRSTNFPVTAGAVRTAAAGNVDGFVARIAAGGNAVQNATYLGTSLYDQAYFVQLGSDGGVYILGQTKGQWPISAGVYSNPGSGQFIQKLSPDLAQVQLSTTIGRGVIGFADTVLEFSPTAFLVDQCDRVYISGWGGNANFARDNTTDTYSGRTTRYNGYTHNLPVTANALRTTTDTPDAGSDFYLAQLSSGMTQLSYATFYGNAEPGSTGDHVDGGTSRFDPRGVAYSAVCSCFSRSGFPIPPGASFYSATNNALNTNPALGVPYLCNNAAFKLNFEPTVATVSAVAGVCVNGGAVPLSGSPSGGVWTGPGVSRVGGNYVFTPGPGLLGTQTLTYTVPSAVASCTVSAQATVTVSPLPTASVTAQPAVCQNAGPVPLTGGTPAGGVWSGPGVTQVGGTYVYTPTAQTSGPVTLTYTVRGVGACANSTVQATTTLQVTPVQAAVVPPDTALCPGSLTPFQLRGTPAGGVWSGPGVTPGGLFTPNGQSGTVTLTYTTGIGQQCQSQATRRIAQATQAALVPVLRPGPCTPSNVAPYTVHYYQDPALLPAGAILTWDFGDGNRASGADVTYSYQTAGTFQPRLTVSYTQGRCSLQADLPAVTVRGAFIPNIITPGSGTANAVFQPLVGGCPPRLQIFSRWGRLVYDDPAYQLTWNADGLVAGLYYYLLTPPDGSPPRKGWVEVVK